MFTTKMVVKENTRESGAWFANLAGGIPPIALDFTTHGQRIPKESHHTATRLRGNVGRSLLRANSAKMWDVSRLSI